MITKECQIEKYCIFYASEFHLEMTILPYIKEELEKNNEAQIISEKNLEKTINILIKRMNFNKDLKEKILKMSWSENIEGEIKITNSEEEIIIINGNEKYIDNINKKLEKIKNKKIKIINCYNLEENENKIDEIVKKHDKNLNIIENKK